MKPNKNITEQTGAMAPKRGFRVGEAASYMGCKPISVRRLIARGLLRPCRALRTLLIPKDQLDALLEGSSHDAA